MEPFLAESSLARPRVAGVALAVMFVVMFVLAAVGAGRHYERHHHHPTAVTVLPMHPHGHLPQLARCRGWR